MRVHNEEKSVPSANQVVLSDFSSWFPGHRNQGWQLTRNQDSVTQMSMDIE